MSSRTLLGGRGHDVSAVTETLRELMRQNIKLWDQSEFMRGLNDAFNKSKKYATAIVLSFHRITGRLAFSNAGHLPPLWYHAAQRSWGWLEEGKPATQKRRRLTCRVNSWYGLQSDGCHSGPIRSSCCALHRWYVSVRRWPSRQECDVGASCQGGHEDSSVHLER
jgi:hypothetical protein